MEVQYLKYFVAVAEKLSFREAAETCHVSQPSLSVQIKLMEEELGYLLFIRSKRSVVLTKEGAHLLPYARRILEDINKLPARVNEYSELESGLLICGISPLIAHSDALRKLLAIKSKFPELRFHIEEASTEDLVSGLRTRKFDLILLPYNSSLEDHAFRYKALDIDKMIYLFPKARGKKSKADLPFISVPVGCGLKQVMEQCARTLKFSTQSLLTAHHADMITHWVELGLGWSILPKRSIQMTRDVALVKPESDMSIEYCICVLTEKRGEMILDSLND